MDIQNLCRACHFYRKCLINSKFFGCFGSDIIRYFIIIDAKFSLIFVFELHNLLNIATYVLNLCLLFVMMNCDVRVFFVISWHHGETGLFTGTEPDGSVMRTFWYINMDVYGVLHYTICLLGHSLNFTLVFK